MWLNCLLLIYILQVNEIITVEFLIVPQHSLYKNIDMIPLFFPVLGAGWSPAVLETFREIDFFRAAQQSSFLYGNNIDFYYISGTVDLNFNSFSNHFNATPSGNCANDESLIYVSNFNAMLNIKE